MKLRKCLLLWLATSVSGLLYGQEVNDNKHFLSIGITPFNLIEPRTPTLEGVVEVMPIHRFSLEAKYGWPTEKVGLKKESINKEKYYEYKLGIKYRVAEIKDRIFPFVGIEYFVVDHQYEKTNDWLTRDGLDYTYDLSRITRNINGFRIRQGCSFRWRKNWIGETYFSFGIRKVVIAHRTVNEQLANDYLWDEWIRPSDRSEINKNKVDFSFGIKVSYRPFSW